jgi:hypothetical protein
VTHLTYPLGLGLKPTGGFEPPTPALRERCSGQLSYVGSRGASVAAVIPSPGMENIPPARVARRFGERLIGLSWSGRPRALALLIPRCRSVHTFGMRFPLDLYWLGPGGDVIRVDRGVRPWRIARCAEARAVVELPVIT